MAAVVGVRSVSLIGYVGCLRVGDGGSPASVHQNSHWCNFEQGFEFSADTIHGFSRLENAF